MSPESASAAPALVRGDDIRTLSRSLFRIPATSSADEVLQRAVFISNASKDQVHPGGGAR